ncbi:MAG: hypothetical protein DRN27_05015 [Thermoplasmata archaeon]|nr:MAG: hypothetical protein DRN27_05015 [Thermoplasmata archaeon]
MGFSVSTATALIGVAIVMSLEVSIGVMIPLYADVSDSYRDMKTRSIDELQTDITINDVNVTSNATLHDLNITIKNTGSIVLEREYITILIDGVIQDYTGSSTYLYPESSDHYLLNGLSGSGEKKIKIITSNGISCYASYNAT